MKASGYARFEHDWYQEPRHAIDGLLRKERFWGECWDPSCGGGNIPEAVKAHGLPCRASDIVDRGYPGAEVGDFFTLNHAVQNIISNPPYGVIEEYIEHALRCADHKVAILARLALLEGQDRASRFWPSIPLARVWVSSRRLSMPPGGTGIKATGGTVAYAWFVMEHGHFGRPAIGWF